MNGATSGDDDSGLPFVEEYYRLFAQFLFELSYEIGPAPLAKFF
jgi:hypothetical protein